MARRGGVPGRNYLEGLWSERPEASRAQKGHSGHNAEHRMRPWGSACFCPHWSSSLAQRRRAGKEAMRPSSLPRTVSWETWSTECRHLFMCFALSYWVCIRLGLSCLLADLASYVSGNTPVFSLPCAYVVIIGIPSGCWFFAFVCFWLVFVWYITCPYMYIYTLLQETHNTWILFLPNLTVCAF